MSAPSAPMPPRMRRVLPQMWSRVLAPSAVYAVDHALLVGPDELLIDLRPDQRGGCIADADQVSARRYLRCGELQFQRQHEVEQPLDKVRVIVEVQHQVVDAAQVGSLGAGAFDPALDQLALAAALLQSSDHGQAVSHATMRLDSRLVQVVQQLLLPQQRRLPVVGRRVVGEEDGRCAAIGGLDGRVGNGGNIVDVIRLRHPDLTFHLDTVIGAVVQV